MSPGVSSEEGVARAGWEQLLPAHRAHGSDQPVGAPHCLAAVKLADGLELVVAQDDAGRTWPVPLHTDARGDVRRAVAGDGASEALLRLLGGGDRTVGDVTVTAWHHELAAGERAITVDQTNESVVVGERAVVKWTVVADEGPHPAISLLAALESAGFTGTPRPWGAVDWRGRLVAIAVDYVPGAVDGWTWAVQEIRDAALSGDLSGVGAAGAAVGELVASFHLALRGTARPATAEETSRRPSQATDDLDQALAVTTGEAHDALQRHEAALRELLTQAPDAATVMRVHGDLHIGQVLRTQAADGPRYLLTDFDGNPVVPPSERGLDQPAAVDVAGMAQSFTHAGLVVRKHNPDLSPEAVTAAAASARAAFVDAHRRGLGDHASLLDEALLQPLAARQVCREFVYAATHLPRWSYVPEAAVAMLLDPGSDGGP